MSDTPPATDQPAPIADLLAHRARVTALARRLVSAADADDVAQETWLAALRSPPRADGTVDRWLLRVARNAAFKVRRGAARRAARDVAAANERRGYEEAPDVVLARAECHRRVVEAVLRLAEPYRSTVLLRWFEDVDVAGIARRHGCPEETVRTRLKRGHAQLRGLIVAGDGGPGDDLCRDGADDAPRRRAARLQAILLPLSGGESAATRAATTATTGGLVATTAAWKFGAAAAAFVVGGALLLWGTPSPDGGGTSAGVATAATTTTPRSHATTAARVASSVGAGAGGANGDTSAHVDAPRSLRRLRVTDERGAVLPDVRATVLGEEREPAVPTGDGCVAVAAGETLRRALVIAPGRPPCVVEVPPGEGVSEIALPGGAAVSGVVRIDGLPPREPVVLQFGYADARTFVGEEAVAAISPYYSLGFEPHRVGAVAGEGGRFRFDGLPDAGPGGIRIPDWLAFRERPALLRAQDVAIPACDVLLDLVSFPRVRGRVLSADAPLAGAFVRVEWTTADGGRSSRTRVVDADGSFLRPVESLDAREVAIVVSDPENRTERAVALPSPLPPIIDLGVIEIAPAASARIRVSGPDGLPITGAVVASGPGGEHIEGETGADGVLEFAAVGGRADVCVAARGFVCTRAAWDVEGERAPHAVMLVPAPLLTVRLDVGQARGPRVAAKLRIDAPAGFFPAPSGPSGPALIAAGASPIDALSHAPEGETQWYAASATAPEWTVLDLAPDVPCRYAVIDGYGTRIADGELRLAAGERRALSIAPSGGARTVTIAVTDEHGRPIHGAAVRVSDAAPGDDAGPQLCYLPTDGDGRAVFGAFRADRAAIRVEHPGRAARVEPSVVVGADGLVLTVRLVPERRLVVRVVDEAGEPVADASVEASIPGAPESGAAFCGWTGVETVPGVCRLAGAPEGALVVTAQSPDGRSGELRVTPEETEVTITLRDGD